ncbi:finTRIM family, member 86 [Cololabis saira]|uniref:finTRIM family, member 86 n=1 Tax=Cololabis saira TaxID=129043 RepID=UPI002AD3E31A|nr:finTRIM family, member 86 [Cololabis saira]
MASAWPEEDSFACSVCLDTLRDPTTLPCGHSYCLACIHNHWDKEDSKGRYSCPQCRQTFKPRPSLARSTLLVEAMEKLRTSSLRQGPCAVVSSAPPSMPIYLEVLPEPEARTGGMYPQLPMVGPRPCPQHNRPLDLFCKEDKECVCEVCCQQGHEGHRVLKPQEERTERQKELLQMQVEVQTRIQDTEKKLKELPNAARQHKASVQALKEECSDLFSELVRSLNVTGTDVCELLSLHETTLGSRLEGHVQGLEQEAVQLRWRGEELGRLAGMQDHICFLKNFFLLEPLGPTDGSGKSLLNQEEAVVASIRSAVKELQESVQDLCKASLAKIFKSVNPDPAASAPNGPAEDAAITGSSCRDTEKLPVCEASVNPPLSPPTRSQSSQASRLGGSLSHQGPRPQASGTTTNVNPEPKTREEMLKFHFRPTMDPNTVYRHVLLADGGHKATMRAENQNPPDHPERFTFWRQVLCKEPLAGSPYYWEVEWTGQKITVGVAYKEMERKGSDDKSRLGHNDLSWSLYWSGTGFSFWHGGQEKQLGSPKAKRIGVYLDQYGGILSFYRISNNQATLLHRHQTLFTGPLHPGFRFWTGVGNTLTVCQLE